MAGKRTFRMVPTEFRVYSSIPFESLVQTSKTVSVKSKKDGLRMTSDKQTTFLFNPGCLSLWYSPASGIRYYYNTTFFGTTYAVAN